MDLRPFCLAHDSAAFIPAEYLGADGLEPDIRAVLREVPGLSGEHLDLFDRGFRLYRKRAASLFDRAPGSWLPPRKANLLVITDPRRVRPYSQPFLGVTWCLHASDLDPRLSNEEWVCYQIFHVERLAFLRSVRASVCFNLSYFLTLDDDEKRDFARAASRATRPDARAFLALARALPWIEKLYHSPLREPRPDHPEPLGHVDGADLLIPRSIRPDLVELLSAFENNARDVEAAFLAAQAETLSGDAPVDKLCVFLESARPDVEIVDGTGKTVYSPEFVGGFDEVRAALKGLASWAGASLEADLRLVDEKSRMVLASLRDPDILSRTSDVVEQDGGVYIRADRRRIVYTLNQPSFDTIREEGSPFHRQLLAARVVHEWGHLVHEARLIEVPETRRADYDEAVRALEQCWTNIVEAMPARLEEDVTDELEGMRATRATAGRALARATLSRLSDYVSNVFFRRYLTPDELSCYVRTNVRHHLNEELGPLAQLARHAMEFQYLALAEIRDPMGYFLGTSYFEGYFLRTGVFTEQGARAVFEATARVCACYELDRAAFVE